MKWRGSAEVKKLTGAKYMVMDGDVGVVESGGKSDFQTQPSCIRRPRWTGCCTTVTR